MAVTVDATKGAYIIPALAGSGYVPLAGGTMTGALTLPGGTAGAPSLMFTGAEATTGLYSPEANVISIAINNSQLLRVDSTAVWSFGSLGFVNVSTSAPFCFGSDYQLLLFRDAAATLALRNGANAQTLRIYGTADGSPGANYQRMVLSANGTTGVTIAAEGLGTPGANQNITLTPGGTGGVVVANSKKLTAVNIGTYAIEDSCTLHAYNAYGLIFEFGSAKKGYMNTDGFKLAAANYYGWVSDTDPVGSAADTALFRNAAGVVEVNNGTAGTWRDLKLRNLLNTEYHQMTEMAAPSAPERHFVRIYAEDNGSGKTRLMARFNTGAAQQIAIEP